MTFSKLRMLPVMAALLATAVAVQAAGADDGSSMQVPLATSATGVVGLFGAVAAAATAVLRRH